MYSDNIKEMKECFYNRNTSNRLNIYVNKNTTNYNKIFNKYNTGSYSLVGANITWTNETTNEGHSLSYNTYYNIYVYGVDNVSNIKPYKYNSITMKNED